MERDQEQKHMCKFCSKRFPCGRSLGGHMRSHLINIPSSDLRRNNEKPPKKKLPPLPMDHQASHGLDHEKKKKKKKGKVPSIQEKACKECGKKFQSWKALFGHMKCHSPNSKIQDSWSDDQDQIMDSQSDNEGTTPLCRRKRSDRIKRYKPSTTITNSSSSLTIETDHHEQEEVALSLIILSRDKGDWGRLNSVVESSDFDSKSIDDERLKLKKLQSPSRTEAKTRKLEALINHEVENEFEVNSPKNPIKSQFLRERKSKSSRKRNTSFLLSQEIENRNSSSKFSCSICKKAFPSYQALGGHRASHKKFKGCCAPREDENSLETESSHNRSDKNVVVVVEVKSKKSKDHECPICFKVFPSGQALGGHKRSHLILDQIKKNASPPKEKPLPEIRAFLDLNLPAPAEEEEFKPWWIGGGSGGRRPPPLLGLLSTS